MTPYELGYAVGVEGDSATLNLYHFGTRSYDEWLDGYEDGLHALGATDA